MPVPFEKARSFPELNAGGGASVPDEYSCEEQSHKQDSEEDETRDITGKEVVYFPDQQVSQLPWLLDFNMRCPRI